MKIDLVRLAAERRAKGFTQLQMSEKMGWESRPPYAKRENGEIKISAEELITAMDILGYTIDDIKLFLKEGN